MDVAPRESANIAIFRLELLLPGIEGTFIVVRMGCGASAQTAPDLDFDDVPWKWRASDGFCGLRRGFMACFKLHG